MYKNKYLKYKNKYLDLKNNINNQRGGSSIDDPKQVKIEDPKPLKIEDTKSLKMGEPFGSSESAAGGGGSVNVNSGSFWNNFNRECEVLSLLFQNIYRHRTDMKMINELLSTNKIILLNNTKNIKILTSILFILDIKLNDISDSDIKKATQDKYESLFYSDNKYSIFGKSKSELTPEEKEEYDDILDVEEKQIEQFEILLKKYNITSYKDFLERLDDIRSIDQSEKQFFTREYYAKMMNGMNQTRINPLYLNKLKVWYGPNSLFFLEEIWKIDIEKFYEEYNNFESTKQSYILYWNNIINILLFLCKIKTCRYYFSVGNINGFFKILENGIFNEKYEYLFGHKYIVKKLESKTASEIASFIGQHKLLTEYSQREIERNNVYKKKLEEIYYVLNIRCKDNEECIYLFKLDRSFVDNDILIQLLFNSFDCNYHNISELYMMILNILCKTFPESLDINSETWDITRQIYGRDLNEKLSKDIGITRELGEIINTENNKKLFQETFKDIFLHYSFNLVNPTTYVRLEPTKIASVLFNPISKLDDDLHYPLLTKISHDLIFHYLLMRKSKIQNKNQVEGRTLILYIYKNNPKYIEAIHELFHEFKSKEPISYDQLLEVIENYINNKGETKLYKNDSFIPFLLLLQTFFYTSSKYEIYQIKIDQILKKY